MLADTKTETKRKSKQCDVDSDDDDDVWLASRPSDPVLIGVSHWGSLKRKKLLGGISVSHTLPDRCFYTSGEIDR